MEKISFTKMSGAGNDFIVLDGHYIIPDPILIQKICDRRNGIGADGVITISSDTETDFRMVYYNSDGYPGSLCGNGARCAIKYAESAGYVKDKFTTFISGNKKYSGELLEKNLVKFNLDAPSGIRRNFLLHSGSRTMNVSFADTGSPHALIFIDELENYFGNKFSLDEIPVDILGREIRNHPEFSPGGTNVNFLSVDDNRLLIRTFERGVEAETFACGTGSVAAAIISFLEKRIEPPVNLITKNGNELVVNFSFRDGNFSDVSLTGPALIIFTGEYKN